MDGFHNRVLHIDVSRRTFEVEPIADQIYRRSLGGKGLGTHLLLNNAKAGVDALSEDNVIVFAVGPVTETMVFGSSRYGVYTKSPLTGLYTESYAGGRVAEPISNTGYDAIMIEGASKEPIYLEISDKCVTFHEASHIWGQDTYEAEDVIRKEVGVKNAGVCVIGPAGENLVRFALISNDYWRCCGRTGPGAVLGSKRIKGIAFHGTEEKRIAKIGLLKKFWEDMRAKGKRNAGTLAYRKYGTTQLVAPTNKAGAFPTKYWSSGTYDKWQSISGEALLQRCKVRPRACPKCFMACGNLTEIIDGRHRGLKIEGPEYETIFAFGGLCLIDDIREIAYLNDICDRLGIDTMSAGNLAGFTIEASRRKAIKEGIDYGDVDGIAELLHQMARREGVGATLAEGIKHASKEWGLEDLAIHVKGLEPAGYDPRVLKGMGLAYATADRGACHLRSTFYKPELAGIIAPDGVEGKAKLFTEWEDRLTIMDALLICRFYRDFYLWDEFSLIIEGATGIKLSEEQLREIAGNILNDTREFNLREGMKTTDDALPKRFFYEKLEDSGKVLPKADMEKMLRDYYGLRGWNQPPPIYT
jgi:aldehyde:ferredoxin oxidoreductase